MAIFFGVLGMLILFGGLGGTMFYIVRKTDPNRVDTSVKDDIQTAQEFLPFSSIENHVTDLGGHQYRAYIEVGSINYFLKTEDEQYLAELSFQRLINAISHPISFFIQTRVANNDEILKMISEDYLKSIEIYPGLTEYAEENFEEMNEMYRQREMELQKRKYIIVPFDDASIMSDMDDEAKHQYALEEIFQRCRIIAELASNLGLKTKILTSAEITELVYTTYHKDSHSHLKALIDGEYTSLIVKGEDRIGNITDAAKLDWILYETQMKLHQEVLDYATNDEIKNSVKATLREIEQLRDKMAGYYKEF